LRENIPSDDKFEAEGLTTFALAMPLEYKTEDPVESYRNYYMSDEKQKIATWKKKRERVISNDTFFYSRRICQRVSPSI
jgi:hypothetical protein